MVSKILLPLAIVVIFTSLFIANFSADLWMTGWDNLHPEFDFGLNISRSIFAVWQEYQGTGLLGGMAHASDLPRQIFLLFLSLLAPASWLRQLYFFLMLLLGPLGVFFLLNKLILSEQAESKRKLASTAGAIFYLLNLATVQAFYAPYAPFAHHFAFLPWLFLASFLLFKDLNRRNLVLFLVVNLAAVPQGYVPTIFLVTFSALVASLLIQLIKLKGRNLGRAAFIISVTLLINAFWFIPFLYFVSSNINIPVEAKINQMANENVFLQNKNFGDLKNVILLRGFWFDNTDFGSNQEFGYMLAPWRQHFDNNLTWLVGYALFGVVLLGIISAFANRNRYGWMFFFLFLASLTILANNTTFFAQIDILLYQLPFVFEALRFPFTKFSVLAAFSYSVFFAFGSLFILSLFEKLPRVRLIGSGIVALFVAGLIYFTLPAFQGHLFYASVKQDIPQEYFELIQFFRTQNPHTRIAHFPLNTFWGWNFYQWGYGGSGFLWYGIRQPILDRAFNVWSDSGENFYWEATYALYSQNGQLFEKVLEKYQVGWLLVDGNVVNPPAPKALFFTEMEEMIAASDKVALDQTLGKIKIYRVDLETPVSDFVFLGQSFPSVGPGYEWGNIDRAYLERGNYILQDQPDYYFPFRTLFTGKTQEDLEFKVEDRGDYFLFKAEIPENVQGWPLTVPETEDELVWVDPDNLSYRQIFKPEVVLSDGKLEVVVPKVGGYFAADIDPTTEPSVQEAKDCNQLTKGEVSNEVVSNDGGSFLRVSAVNTTNCSPGFWLPNLPHNLAYLITVESRNIEGKSFVFWLENIDARKADIETYLPKNPEPETSFIIQPPMNTGGLSYSLHFDNVSIGQFKSVNDLGKISVNPIPYRFLAQLTFSRAEGEVESRTYQEVQVKHPNPSVYDVSLNQQQVAEGAVLVLSQSFHPGWRAYQLGQGTPAFLAPIRGEKLREHLLVNNWANGWRLAGHNQNRVVIIYQPQFLEFIGFLLPLILLPVLIWRLKFS